MSPREPRIDESRKRNGLYLHIIICRTHCLYLCLFACLLFYLFLVSVCVSVSSILISFGISLIRLFKFFCLCLQVIN